ncbi:hypothetical protein EU524_01420, partial [Candidatus Thorarchaeota archaeon]
MAADLQSMVIANLVYSFQMTPPILFGASIVRVVLLLSGQKREFEDWTRNKLLTFLSIIFLPGTLAFMGIRLLLARVFGIGIEDVASSSTYGEINVFLKVEKPPRVGIVLSVLFLNVLLAVFTAFSLVVVPIMFLLQPLWLGLCWWIAIGILFNCSVRSGDLSLLFASM